MKKEEPSEDDYKHEKKWRDIERNIIYFFIAGSLLFIFRPFLSASKKSINNDWYEVGINATFMGLFYFCWFGIYLVDGTISRKIKKIKRKLKKYRKNR